MHNFKVNFMILGAMKCGTSTLSKILSKHPEISFCKKKEPNYFSSVDNWRENIEQYNSLFKVEKGKIYGEASTSYTKYPFVNKELWNDLHDYNSNLKFIYLVRNPIDRAISQYMHNYERGIVKSSISNSILSQNIINTGRYYTQIKPYIDKFGHSKVLIISFEDLLHNREDVLKEISGFLNIDFKKFKDFEDVHINKSVGSNKKSRTQLKYEHLFIFFPKIIRNKILKFLFDNSKRSFNKKPELELNLKKAIANLTMLDIIELEKLTGKDFSGWKNIQ